MQHTLSVYEISGGENQKLVYLTGSHKQGATVSSVQATAYTEKSGRLTTLRVSSEAEKCLESLNLRNE